MMIESRDWLLTWTTYGTWLPGDERGFVGRVMDQDQTVINNFPGTDYDLKHRGLKIDTAKRLKSQPILLTTHHAVELHLQFEETAAFRNGAILWGAMMDNHVHLVVRVSAIRIRKRFFVTSRVMAVAD
jgi:hypothetical protein